MRTQKISVDKTDVHIECPFCRMTEQHPIDEQRSHLQNFRLISWTNDTSITQCMSCNSLFNLEWDYENKEL